MVPTRFKIHDFSRFKIPTLQIGQIMHILSSLISQGMPITCPVSMHIYTEYANGIRVSINIDTLCLNLPSLLVSEWKETISVFKGRIKRQKSICSRRSLRLGIHTIMSDL